MPIPAVLTRRDNASAHRGIRAKRSAWQFRWRGPREPGAMLARRTTSCTAARPSHFGWFNCTPDGWCVQLGAGPRRDAVVEI